MQPLLVVGRLTQGIRALLLRGLLPVGGKDEVVASSLYVSQRLGETTRVMLGKINVIDLLAAHPFFGA